jgi:hypothetical protein
VGAFILRFKHESFAMGFISIAKPLPITVFVGSDVPLEGRVALGPAREPTFGPSR